MEILEQKLIKKEKEAEILNEALKKAQRRLGGQIISDTDADDTLSDSDSQYRCTRKYKISSTRR